MNLAMDPDAPLQFYVGLHHPHDAQHFERCMISIHRIRDRRSSFAVGEWMLDSGAFTELSRFGHYRHEPEDYAAQIARWSHCGQLVAAVSQDYMCEQFILNKTRLTIADHQRLTIERYDKIVACVAESALQTYVMPVLQGFKPYQYVSHARQYGARLAPKSWVGVGSVCKRNANVTAIEDVLMAIHAERPDLRLHGFGLKTTALRSKIVRACLHSADSMAWSFAARRDGRDANDWREAAAFVERIAQQPVVNRPYQYRMEELL